MEFREKIKNELNQKLINKLKNEFNLSIEVVKILVSRGYDTSDKIKEFITPGITKLYNPFLLKNMNEVIKKINHHISSGHKITIVGDYDTDGISASAILYKYFQSIDFNCNVFLPNRSVDGYGLTNDSVDKVIKMYNPDLIITVDCGISNHNEIEYIKSKGVDVIVTDHHDIPEILPDCLIVNAKLPNQDYPFSELCGAGVALKIVQAMGGVKQALKYSTLACIATIADIVPLVDENRTIVSNGLNLQNDNLPIGLKKLCKKYKIKLPFSSADVSFKIAPKINSTGRMDDAITSFLLYTSQDEKEIDNLIKEVDRCNSLRINESNLAYEQSLEQLKPIDVSKLGMITVVGENWAQGVVGIIASKLVDKFNKPVCVLTKSNDIYKGSCRSIPSINIFETLSHCKDLLLKFGGHNQAGGLSLEKENIEKFKIQASNYILQNNDESKFLPFKYYDIDLSKIKLSNEFIDDLFKLEPFGYGNEKPIFKLSFNTTNATRLPKHPNHIKINFPNLNVIGYNIGEYYYNLISNCTKELLLDITKEKYNNKEILTGTIKSLRFDKLNTSTKKEFVKYNYLKQITIKENSNLKMKTIKTNDFDAINEITNKSLFGSLIICSCFESYLSCVNNIKNIVNYDVYQLSETSNVNTILFMPNVNYNEYSFKNIILFDRPLSNGFLGEFKGNIFQVDNDYHLIKNSVLSDRNTFAKYFTLIKNVVINQNNISSETDLFSKIKKMNSYNKFDFLQFVYVLFVMVDLNIIQMVNGCFNLTDIKNNLENSYIYNTIKKIV